MNLKRFVAAPLAGRSVGPNDGAFVMAEWTDDGNQSSAEFPIAPLHVHHDDDEAWYVLEGRLQVRLGGQTVDAPAGTAVFGPRGLAHTYWNPDPRPARYLIVMTPSTAGMIAELHALETRTPENVRALFQRHRCELL